MNSRFSFRNVNILFDLQSWPNEIYVHNILRSNKRFFFASYMLVMFAISLVKKLHENQYSYPCIHVWALLNIISTLSHWTTESHLVWEKRLPREWFAWTKLHVNDFDIIITTHWIVQQGIQYKKINGDWSALHKSNKL